MHYIRIIQAFANEIWAIDPVKLRSIVQFLAFKADGGMLSASEIEAAIGPRKEAQLQRMNGDIAVIPVFGTIMQRADMMTDISGGVSTEALSRQIAEAVADDSIKAIVMNFDSGGGGTFGVEELGAEIKAATAVKPIISQINSVAASAAYWLASQANEIVATPGGIGGSIGVYAVHEDISKALEMQGINPTLVKAGENKAETIDFLPLTPEARDAIQHRVDQTMNTFEHAVAEGRRTTLANVRDNFGRGRAFTAKDMAERGMVDGIGTLSATLQRLGGSKNLRGQAAAQMRAYFAKNETPPLKVWEAYLREGGCPADLATGFVSRGKVAIPRGEPVDEAKQTALEALRRLNAQASGIILNPKGK